MEYLRHRGERIPLIGLGTYRFGENGRQDETAVLKYGISRLGMTLLDTAEMYGGGLSEEILGEAVRGLDRDSLFIVDKILPRNAAAGRFRESCTRSLERLGTDCIDLYLLHWRGNADLQQTVCEMERLVSEGLIRHWGVSNFDTDDMQELFECEMGSRCFCDQILYNITARGAEFDLIPWCKEHDVLVMGYSPLCNCSSARRAVAGGALAADIAAREGKTPESLMLSFAVRNRDIAAVFKTASIPHLEWNMQNVFEPIPPEELELLSAKYPPPDRKYPLEKI